MTSDMLLKSYRIVWTYLILTIHTWPIIKSVLFLEPGFIRVHQFVRFYYLPRGVQWFKEMNWQASGHFYEPSCQNFPNCSKSFNRGKRVKGELSPLEHSVLATQSVFRGKKLLASFHYRCGKKENLLVLRLSDQSSIRSPIFQSTVQNLSSIYIHSYLL